MQMDKLTKYLIFALSFFSLVEPAFAYLDPGTGGVILSSLWPLVVAFFTGILGFLVKHFWKPLKKSFFKIFGLNKK